MYLIFFKSNDKKRRLKNTDCSCIWNASWYTLISCNCAWYYFRMNKSTLLLTFSAVSVSKTSMIFTIAPMKLPSITHKPCNYVLFKTVPKRAKYFEISVVSIWVPHVGILYFSNKYFDTTAERWSLFNVLYTINVRLYPEEFYQSIDNINQCYNKLVLLCKHQ